jgi:type IV pilus assembly protein PilO
MDRNDRNILILGFLILILLGVAYYFLLFSPLSQEYLAKYNERTQKEARKGQLEQSVARLEGVRRDAPNIERQILELSKRIPEQDEIPTLLVQIESVAMQSGVEQFEITPSPPETPPNGSGDFSRIPVTMTFLGDYEDLQDFLLRTRNLSRLMTVNQVTYCRFPEPISSEASCGVDIELAEEEGETDMANRGALPGSLEVEIQAEVYVQPAAGGTTTGGGGTAPAGGGAAPSPEGGTPKGGGAPK